MERQTYVFQVLLDLSTTIVMLDIIDMILSIRIDYYRVFIQFSNKENKKNNNNMKVHFLLSTGLCRKYNSILLYREIYIWVA